MKSRRLPRKPDPWARRFDRREDRRGSVFEAIDERAGSDRDHRVAPRPGRVDGSVVLSGLMLYGAVLWCALEDISERSSCWLHDLGVLVGSGGRVGSCGRVVVSRLVIGSRGGDLWSHRVRSRRSLGSAKFGFGAPPSTQPLLG